MRSLILLLLITGTLLAAPPKRTTSIRVGGAEHPAGKIAQEKAAAARAVSGLTVFFEQIIPLVIVGDGWSQRLVLQNVDDQWSTYAEIEFFTRDGREFPVSVAGVGTGALFTARIEVGSTILIDLTPSFQPQQLGWARIIQYLENEQPNDMTGYGSTFGQLIFRKQYPGLPDFMCSMVLGGTGFEKLTTYFDNTNGNYTGMGILTSLVTTRTAPVELLVRVRDMSGEVLSEKVIEQDHMSLYWMNLGVDFPATNGRVGTFEVEPVGEEFTTLTGFSLQFSANGAFTVITPFEN